MQQLIPFLRYIANTNYLPNHHFTRSYDCRFLYILDGRGILLTEFGDFPLEPDSFVYYPAGTSYYPKSSEESPLQFITANFDFTLDYIHNTSILPPVEVRGFDANLLQASQHDANAELFLRPFSISSAVPLKADLLRLVSLFQSGDHFSQQRCSALLALVLYEVFSAHQESSIASPIVNQVKTFISQHYHQPLDNRMIADALKYHPYYLNSIFKSNSGYTIHKYLQKYRLSQSQTMILHTDLPLSTIAESCGFVNVDHFSRCFKQQFGMTPTEYRKKYNVV